MKRKYISCQQTGKVWELHTFKKFRGNIFWGDCLNSEKNLGGEKFSSQN